MASRTHPVAEGSPVRLDQTPTEPMQGSSDRPPRRTLRIDVTGGAVAKIVVGLLALGVLAGLMDRMRDVFIWTLAALFLAIALNPLVERLEPRIGRRPAATVVFLAFVIGFVAVVAAFVAPFVTQVDQLSTGLPKAIADAKHNSTINGSTTAFTSPSRRRSTWTRCRASSSAQPAPCWRAPSRFPRSSSSPCSCCTSCRRSRAWR